MNISEFNPKMRMEVQNFKQDFREDSSAFLMWFLDNIFCLDERVAIDSVCDGTNDKGIDGIWVDDYSEEIYIFQSKFSPNDNRDQGDTDIRKFAGTKPWFSSEENVNRLLSSLANIELKGLIENLNIAEKVANEYHIISVFVTNKIFDTNAKEFLETCTNMEAYDNNSIFEKYTYITEMEIGNTPKTLEIPNITAIEYNNVEGNETIVLPIPAEEIINLDGIQDHSLFSRNVRFWVGRTRVNNDIKKTLIQQSEHSKFFLYHNGITIVCNNFNFDKDNNKITLENYQVNNGCQSIISFYENRSLLTSDIHVLTKIIKVEPHNPLIQKITHNANNQNAISLKDLKSNDRIQIGLQNRFSEFFDRTVLYKIKRGESEEGYDKIINIDFAAQLIVAFYFKEPYNTHLKTKMFSDLYNKIFSRRMTCQKIYLANLIYEIIEDNEDKTSNLQIRNYGLAKFAILSFFKDILENEELGKNIIENPDEYLIGEKFEILKNSITKLFELIVLDINAFIDEHIRTEEFFDYKNIFKNREFVENMNSEILKEHKKVLIRHPEDSFSDIFMEQESSFS